MPFIPLASSFLTCTTDVTDYLIWTSHLPCHICVHFKVVLLLASLFAVQQSNVFVFSIQHVVASVPTIDVQIAIMDNTGVFLSTSAIMSKVTESSNTFNDLGK